MYNALKLVVQEWKSFCLPSDYREMSLCKDMIDIFELVIMNNKMFKVFGEESCLFSPQSMLLSGPTGVGKTSSVNVFTKLFYANASNPIKYWQSNCKRLNASSERGINVIRNEVIPFSSYESVISFLPQNGFHADKTSAAADRVLKNKRFVVFDEADNLTEEAQMSLKAVMEANKNNCCFIFMCNNKNKIIEAIKSRCINIDFPALNEESLITLLQSICKKVQNRITEGPVISDVVTENTHHSICLEKSPLQNIRFIFDHHDVINENSSIRNEMNVCDNDNNNIDNEYVYDMTSDKNLFRWIAQNSVHDGRKATQLLLEILSSKILNNVRLCEDGIERIIIHSTASNDKTLLSNNSYHIPHKTNDLSNFCTSYMLSQLRSDLTESLENVRLLFDKCAACYAASGYDNPCKKQLFNIIKEWELRSSSSKMHYEAISSMVLNNVSIYSQNNVEKILHCLNDINRLKPLFFINQRMFLFVIITTHFLHQHTPPPPPPPPP